MKKMFLRIFSIITFFTIIIGMNIFTVYGTNSNNIAKVSNVKITKKSDRIVFKWKKVKKATGYIIKITKDKKFKKELLKITLKNNKNKYTYKNLKTFTKGKKYYVKVRAYKKINGIKKYGKWSKKKSFTIKKKTDKATGYWCDEGGTHHSCNDNTIGWYNTAKEAEEKTFEYLKKNGTGHYLLEQCDFCRKWTAVIKLDW